MRIVISLCYSLSGYGLRESNFRDSGAQESGVRYWRVKIDSARRLLSRCSKSFAPKTAFTRGLSLMVSTEEGIVPQDRESGGGWISTIGSWDIFFGSVSPRESIICVASLRVNSGSPALELILAEVPSREAPVNLTVTVKRPALNLCVIILSTPSSFSILLPSPKSFCQTFNGWLSANFMGASSPFNGFCVIAGAFEPGVVSCA